MRIVAWNCCRGPLAKKVEALDTLSADIAILTEAPSAEQSERLLWVPSGVSSLGVQVRAADGYQLRCLPRADIPNCVTPVQVIGPESFTLLAVWTWPAPSYVKAFTNALDAYSGLIGAGPTVVAGDFNGNPMYDKPRQLIKWGDAFTRLNELGLVSAYHQVNEVEYGEEADPTHHYLRKPDRPFHIDFCFVPREWALRGLNATINSDEEWRAKSDHFPIVVDVASRIST